MKFRRIAAAPAAFIILFSALVAQSDAASSWGMWNDPQGTLISPGPGATPAPDVQEPAALKVQESKPEKKWELWNDPWPKVASTPPVTSAQVPPATVVTTPVTETAVATIAAPATTPAPPPVATSTQAATEEHHLPDVNVAPGDGYVIGAGDILDVAVWKDEALTKSVVVLPDGTISFPLAGDVRAAGKTVAAFRADMEQRLNKYVTELVLSVEVKQINSMHIYVIGRVNSPGRQALNSNVTVLQALSLAGGLNPFAKKDRITVMRTEGGDTKSYPFHYSEVVEGEKLGQNIVLKRGDVVVVP